MPVAKLLALLYYGTLEKEITMEPILALLFAGLLINKYAFYVNSNSSWLRHSTGLKIAELSPNRDLVFLEKSSLLMNSAYLISHTLVMFIALTLQEALDS